MVLGKLPVPGRPTDLDLSKERAYCACSMCGWGLFGNVFSRLSFLLSFSLSLGGLVVCLGFNGPLRQYFSLYRAVPQREGERGKKGNDETKKCPNNPQPHLLQAH